MKPVLYQCGLFTIYTYGVFVAIAFLVSTFLLVREARQRRIDENLIYNLSIVFLVGGIIFARLFYAALNWDYFRDNLLEIIMLSHGGLVWFGGLTGAFVSGLIFLKIKRMPILPTLDLFAPYIALAQAIGRIGCFFNGCCHGRESEWGIYFPAHHQILFPSQLVDSLTLLVIFIVLRFFCAKTREGEIFSFYVMLAALQRFLMEFFRGDLRPFYRGLSIFQWISLGLFCCGLFFYLVIRWKRRQL